MTTLLMLCLLAQTATIQPYKASDWVLTPGTITTNILSADDANRIEFTLPDEGASEAGQALIYEGGIMDWENSITEVEMDLTDYAILNGISEAVKWCWWFLRGWVCVWAMIYSGVLLLWAIAVQIWNILNGLSKCGNRIAAALERIDNDIAAR